MLALPINKDEFATAMQVVEPFESKPHLAIAVSGGVDSMTLALLSHCWAKPIGGSVTALIVDHGLRDASAGEARLTKERLSKLGIPSVVLQWVGNKPTSAVQAEARAARYDLMDAWCRDHDVLHLLIGHHANDQAETFMMRVKHGSGPDGLAAMATVRMLSSCRIIRPLLAFPKERLVATIEREDVPWIEDPSNIDTKYGRVKVREELAENSTNIIGMMWGAERFRRARHALEAQVSHWLARYADLRPEGYLRLSLTSVQQVNPEIRLRILSKAVIVVGGNVYPPSISSIERLDKRISAGNGATLGGVRFVMNDDEILVCREARNLPSEMLLDKGSLLWDQRFLIGSENQKAMDAVLPWSPKIAAKVSHVERPVWFQAIPDCARLSFPVIKSDKGYTLVRPGCTENKEIYVQFFPKIPLSGEGFSVA